MRKNYVGIVVGVREIVSEQYLVDGIYKVDTKCQKCGSIKSVGASHFISSEGSCSNCRTGGRYNKANLMGNIYGDFVVTGETNYSTGVGRVPLRCVECGHEKSIITSGIRGGMICRKCHPVVRKQKNAKQADPEQYMGKVVGFQKIVSEIIFQENGHHRVELECIECGHRKTMAIHDLFRKNRKTGGCTKCKAGITKPKNIIGKVVGDLIVVEELGGTPHRMKRIVVECAHCGSRVEKYLGTFLRSGGQCPDSKCYLPRRDSGRDKRADLREYASWYSLKCAFKKITPNMSCAICGITEWNGYKFPFEMDHIVPLSKGGKNTINNIQPLCGNCHKIKSALEHDNWQIESAE